MFVNDDLIVESQLSFEQGPNLFLGSERFEHEKVIFSIARNRHARNLTNNWCSF